MEIDRCISLYNIHSTSTYAHTYHAVHQLHPPTDSGGLVATAEATAKAVTSKTEIQKERSTLQVAAVAGVLFRAQRCTVASQLNSRRNLRSDGRCDGTLLEALGKSLLKSPLPSCGGCGVI